MKSMVKRGNSAVVAAKKETDNNDINNNEQFRSSLRNYPPSHSIRRVNLIQVDPEKFREFLSMQMNPSSPEFNQNLRVFTALMEKIRLAVQSNLGLSAVARDSHETYHPILIKKGNADFQVDENGNVNQDEVVYDSVRHESTLNRNSPRVVIVRDQSNEEGLSILFKTKFRTFSMHIDAHGKVESTLELNWKDIYEDLSPDIADQQQPLRSFTPWQRHSESNFFNGRSTNKALSYLAETYPSVFTFNSHEYYRDSDSKTIDINTAANLEASSPNLYLRINESLVSPPTQFDASKSPILAIVKRKSPLLGNLIQLVPAIFEDGILHILLHGHQDETEVQAIYSCDLEKETILPWTLTTNLLIRNNKPTVDSAWSNLHLLKHEYQEILKHTAAAPMVRASDVALRKYWHGHYDIPTVYTEMITMADIFKIDDDKSLTPQERLENIYYSDSASSSFRRLIFSEYELSHADHVAAQVVVPHDSANDPYFWGVNGEHIPRTLHVLLQILLKMVPDESHHKLCLAINMCCPAASVERTGGGFGLCSKQDFIDPIVKTVKAHFPHIPINFKTLMMSDDELQAYGISFQKNQGLSEKLGKAGADGLVWQGKPRNLEIYDLPAVAKISQTSQVSHLKYGYSGMVAALKNDGLFKLGYKEAGKPHYSVEDVLSNMNNTGKDQAEVMLGRVLLGSSWLLAGRYATDEEILLSTLLQCFLLSELAAGAGAYGIDLMQIHVMYNLRHLFDDGLRDTLMSSIFDARSSQDMIQIIYEGYKSIAPLNDLGEDGLLKPSMLRLKSAISRAGYPSLYSSRETKLIENQVEKHDVLMRKVF